jgi:hypothetical protein
VNRPQPDHRNLKISNAEPSRIWDGFCIGLTADEERHEENESLVSWRPGRGVNRRTVTAMVVMYEAFVEGKLRCAETSCSDRARPLL